jgi:hypothetical protein
MKLEQPNQSKNPISRIKEKVKKYYRGIKLKLDGSTQLDNTGGCIVQDIKIKSKFT